MRFGSAVVLAGLVLPCAAGAETLVLDAGVLEHLRGLPAQDVSYRSGDPGVVHVLHGPLLWAVLVDARLVDPARHGDAVRQVVRLEGTDGYVAVVAGGEVSPEFENKAVLLALSQDGTALAHPRVYVPQDRRGGRGVHDVASIVVEGVARGR